LLSQGCSSGPTSFAFFCFARGSRQRFRTAVGLGYDGLLFLTPTRRQEHRVWQQLSYNHRWKPLAALLRFRLEERIFSDAKRISVRGRFFTGIGVAIVKEVELHSATRCNG
jgi:hypothetical protein